MIITRIHNNNIATAVDDQKKEVIVTGSGVAFGKRVGDTLEEEKIEKVFVPRTAKPGTPLDLMLRDISTEIYAVTEEIVQHAKEELGISFSDNVYLGLIDHIDFAVERAKSGKQVESFFSDEIRFFYPKEYKVGLDALEIIKLWQGIRLPEEEAAYIALHLINASIGGNMHETMSMTAILGQVIELIEKNLHLSVDRKSTAYFRLVSHLKLFSQFLLKKSDLPQKLESEEQKSLIAMLSSAYPKVSTCTEKISQLIESSFDVKISDEEKIYLTLYILPIVNRGA